MDTSDLKYKINKIIGDALTGIELKYRYERNYIRWGLVEEDINSVIDDYASQQPDSSDDKCSCEVTENTCQFKGVLKGTCMFK